MRREVLIVILLVVMFVSIIGMFGTAGASGGEGQYKKEITINENSGKTLIDYQIMVELNQSNFPDKAKSDGSDLRFAEDGKELSYWIEDYDAGAKTARIWVKVPNIPANGETKIKMYYGNPSASALSNGDSTFELFDDFESYTVGDINGQDAWSRQTSYGLCEVSTTIAKEEKSLRVYDDTSSGFPHLTKNIQLHTSSFVIEFDYYPYAFSPYYLPPPYQNIIGGHPLDVREDTGKISYAPFHIAWRSDLGLHYFNTGSQWTLVASNVFTNGAWNKITYKVIDFQNLDVYVDNKYIGRAHEAGAATKVSYITFGSTGTSPTGDEYYIDNIRIRKYTSPEPTVTIYEMGGGGCGRITNWKTMCQGVYSPGQKVGAEMEFENLMAGGYNFKGVILIRSPTGDEYTNREVEWVPSAPNPQGKFAAADALYVTIPEGASAGNYDMKLELWNDDTDELCDATEWVEDLFTVDQGITDAVHLMHFDEGSGTVAGDSSGYGNDGTIHGATWTTGVSGKALSFDGVDDYVDCGTDPILQVEEAITVSVWVKRRGGAGIERGIVEAYGLGQSPYGYRLSYRPNEGQVRWVLRIGVHGKSVASDGDLPLNEWAHVVGVRDSDGNMYMYINGVTQTDTKVYTNTLNPKLPLYIGRHANYYFDGIIDEVRIYNRALTESEIRALYEQGGDTTPSNLLENTGFESGELDPWYSTEYYDPYKKCDWIIIGVDSEARYEGLYGVYINIQCSLDAWGRIIQEPIEITLGESLAVEAKLMYKGDLSDGYAELWLVFLDADKKSLDHVYKKYYESDFGAEDKWLSAVLPATTAPSNAKYVRIMVGLADVKSCRLNIDDVILKYGSAIGNHPPTVIRVEPASEEVTKEFGDTITFKVKAEDLDEEVHNNLKMIKWFIGDEAHSPKEIRTDPADGKSAEASLTYTFDDFAIYSVRATIYDEQMEEDSVMWEVRVGNTLPEPYEIPYEAIIQREAVGAKAAYCEIVWPNTNIFYHELDMPTLKITALDGCKIGYFAPLYTKEDDNIVEKVILSVGASVLDTIKFGSVPVSTVAYTIISHIIEQKESYGRMIDTVTLELDDFSPTAYLIQICRPNNERIEDYRIKITASCIYTPKLPGGVVGQPVELSKEQIITIGGSA